MFIKLTKFDNRPVWLNASFIVTVEPRRDGAGAVVVPIGDGLDYDVRETPEQVLRMLESAPTPTVVPVPVSDCLTKTPDDVSPEPERRRESEQPRKPLPVPQPDAQTSEPSAETEKPKKRPLRKTRSAAALKKTKAAAKEQDGIKPEEVAEAPKAEPASTEPAPKAESAPVESAPAESATAEPAPAEPANPAPVESPAVIKAELELSDADIVRLRKLAPKSLGKLKNTLVSQFRIADVGANVAALANKGVFTLEGNRVVWATEQADW